MTPNLVMMNQSLRSLAKLSLRLPEPFQGESEPRAPLEPAEKELVHSDPWRLQRHSELAWVPYLIECEKCFL